MRRLLLASALPLLLSAPLHAQEIIGTGSAAPAPLYLRWFAEYQHETGIPVSYSAFGTNPGIKSVGFGAGERPLSEDETCAQPGACPEAGIGGAGTSLKERNTMPEPTSAPLCTVFSTYSPVEAHIVSGMLEDAGIKCILGNEFFAAADNPVSNASGGVQVFVRAADADQARALLADAETQKT